jgi:F1F0 ATPase subunit 2
MAANRGGDMTANIYNLLFSFTAGILIGLFYFGGLWWTVRKLSAVREPVLWTMGSFVIRASVSLITFYFTAEGDWKNLLICLSGFILMRIIMLMRIRQPVISGRYSVGRDMASTDGIRNQ